MIKKTTITICLMGLMASCASMPKGSKPINEFDAQRYLGKWYEVARLDHRFERNMDNTTAEYSLNDNGTIKVVNSGYNYVKKKNEQAIGVAKFADKETVGKLKVSFFKPFYGAYNIVALDKDYQYSLVVGKNTKYMWILSRTKTIPDNIRLEYLEIAKQLGFDTDKLIWVKHD